MSETTTTEPEFLTEIKAHPGAWCFMYEGEDGQSWTQGSFAPDHAAAEITKLTSQLDEARAKAIEECARISDGYYSEDNECSKAIRALLHGSTK